MSPDIHIIHGVDPSRHLVGLSKLLHVCVAKGASLGFVEPFSVEDSTNFWQDKVFNEVKAGHICLFMATVNDSIIGSVQLNFPWQPNQPHRSEIAKLIVDPDYRRQGIAKALMREAEDVSLQLNRPLITLDTRTDDNALPLYRSLGYSDVGIIPDYAVNPANDGFHDTMVMYKQLD